MDVLSSNTWQVSAKPLQGLHLLLLLSKHAAMCDKSRITVCQRNPSEWSDASSDSTASSLEVWKPGELKKAEQQSQPCGFPEMETADQSGWVDLLRNQYMEVVSENQSKTHFTV